MNAKHTPGPWTASVMMDGSRPCGHRVCAAEGLQVAHCILYQDGITTLAETEANAHLIVAAPDLLDAAESILRDIEDREKRTGIIQLVPVMNKLRAAIAKARP